MRNVVISILAILVISSCNQSSEKYTINLELNGAEGKWVVLTARENREYVVYDSVLVESETLATLSGSVEGIRTMYVSLKGERKSVKLLMENTGYSLSGTIDEPVIETSGKAQTELNAYNEITSSIESKLASIVEEYYAAKELENQEKADSVLSIYKSVNAEKESVDSVYLAGNLTSAVSVLILRNSFYAYDTEALETVLNSLDPSLHQMDEYMYMYDIMEKQKDVAIGQHYKDFGLETPEGEMLKISDVHNGNVLLIDFWASWCGPCRRANPEVVAMYNEYHDQGFDVIGVSLDSDAASWKKAIEDDNLTWHHISDVKGWDCEGSKLYGVPAIPHTVLVDREGIIRGKKLHGEELKEAIISLL